jgi:Macrocin-O-methyltransferase (TylF)
MAINLFSEWNNQTGRIVGLAFRARQSPSKVTEMKRLIKKVFHAFGHDVVKLGRSKLTKPIDENYVEILNDLAFQASVKEVSRITMLDTARLANLWMLCRASNPFGSLIEVGSYKGGGALHISNSSPTRPIFVCDTFEGFGDLKIDPALDRYFGTEQFTDTSFEAVKAPWAGKGRDVRWVRGYFPDSAKNLEITNISFAHIDTDLYESTAKTLDYLQPRLVDQSIIVFDDYFRSVDGVVKAVREFTEVHPDWAAFPLFPGQGLVVHRDWFV